MGKHRRCRNRSLTPIRHKDGGSGAGRGKGVRKGRSKSRDRHTEGYDQESTFNAVRGRGKGGRTARSGSRNQYQDEDHSTTKETTSNRGRGHGAGRGKGVRKGRSRSRDRHTEGYDQESTFNAVRGRWRAGGSARSRSRNRYKDDDHSTTKETTSNRGRGHGARVFYKSPDTNRGACGGKYYSTSDSESDKHSTFSYDDTIENMLLEFGGRATLRELTEHLQTCTIAELYSYFQLKDREQKTFLIFPKQKQQESIVVIFNKSLKLCVQYTSTKGCQKKSCQYIHICRGYISKSCQRRPCQFSHDIGDDHNLSIARRLDVVQYNCRDRLTLIRSSIPKVCTEYNNPGGCESSEAGCCPDVHICSKMLLNNCTRDSHNCQYNHDVFNCSQTLAKYISMKSSNGLLEKVILVPAHLRQAQTGHVLQERTKPKDWKMPIIVQSENDGGPSAVENHVFNYLLQKHNGMGSMWDVLTGCRGFSSMNLDKVNEWFQKRQQFTVFCHKLFPKLSLVIVRTNTLKLCFSTDCNNNSCKYFHVCHQFVVGRCHALRCKFSHNLRDEHNERILTDSHLPSGTYNDNDIRNLLRCSLLKCCAVYNEANVCDRQSFGTCPDIHICSKFLQGKCPNPDKSCPYGHDLKSEACLETLKHYRMDRLPLNTLKEMILVVGTNISEPSSMEYSKNTYICEANLRRACSEASKCPYHHFKLPYLWQVRMNDQWISLDHVNSQIEKLYCDASTSTVSVTITNQISVEGILNFDTFEVTTKQGRPLAVRRLTTQSYINDTDADHFTTCWLWYWKRDMDIWHEYGEDGNPPFQDVLEASFASGLMFYHFEHNGRKYEIQFNRDNLVEVNEKTRTNRLIRRRPIYIENMNVQLQILPKQPARYYNATELPKHWHPMDTKTPEAYEKIQLSNIAQEYTEVAKAFRTTMPLSKIQKLYKIQNFTHWRNYERKKELQSRLYNRKKSELEEKKLFHGTDAETIECICRQNFDPRMHGKNACKFGKGAYFASDAKYSHAFTGGGEAKTRSMFYARVLPGRKTKGNSSMQRPPPVDRTKPAGELYGSCVNDVYSPTIFVIFERDQCYPEYLIEYKDDPPQSAPSKPRVISKPVPSQMTMISTSNPLNSIPPPKPRDISMLAPSQPIAASTSNPLNSIPPLTPRVFPMQAASDPASSTLSRTAPPTPRVMPMLAASHRTVPSTSNPLNSTPAPTPRVIPMLAASQPTVPSTSNPLNSTPPPKPRVVPMLAASQPTVPSTSNPLNSTPQPKPRVVPMLAASQPTVPLTSNPLNSTPQPKPRVIPMLAASQPTVASTSNPLNSTPQPKPRVVPMLAASQPTVASTSNPLNSTPQPKPRVVPMLAASQPTVPSTSNPLNSTPQPKPRVIPMLAASQPTVPSTSNPLNSTPQPKPRVVPMLAASQPTIASTSNPLNSTPPPTPRVVPMQAASQPTVPSTSSTLSSTAPTEPRVIRRPAPSQPTIASTSNACCSHACSSSHSMTRINLVSSRTSSYEHPFGGSLSAASHTTNSSNLSPASLNLGSNSCRTSPATARQLTFHCVKQSRCIFQ